jgi:hypothetical protein
MLCQIVSQHATATLGIGTSSTLSDVREGLGSFIFVFTTRNDTSDSPKYAIGLQDMEAKVNQAAAGSRGHVLLETNTGEMEYELSFSTGAIAQEFARTVTE